MQKKRLILISFFFTGLLAMGFSQEKNGVFFNFPPVSKGEITLADGVNLEFTNLRVAGDSVLFTDSKSNLRAYRSDEVFKISKTGNYALIGAISGGVLGYASARLGTSEWEQYPELRDKRSTYVIGCTLLGAISGGLSGYFIKWQKTVFRNDAILGFYPSIHVNHRENPEMAIVCRINISR